MPEKIYTNQELAQVFTLIGDLLEIKGEVIYVILAYRKVAESLQNLGREAADHWKGGSLKEIPGVGKAIAEKIDELFSTGELRFLENLKQEVPESLAAWKQIPGLGPKKIALIWKSLGITTMDELREATVADKVAGLPGMGKKSAQMILDGMDSLSRRSGRLPLWAAAPVAEELLAVLAGLPQVSAVSPAGSYRRGRSTVGDLDILVASTEPSAVMDAFTGMPGVARILGKGQTKSSVEFSSGVRAQVWVHPPHKFGTALVYATGSKEHNVALRQLALTKGYSLSEHSLVDANGAERFFATEVELYEALGLQWVPPEMREDQGEAELAAKGQLPRLIELGDIRADLQNHSTWSDGEMTILEMARAAMANGIRVIAFTDHSQSLGITGGLTIERHAEQQKEIEAAQREVGDGIRILHAAEVEIKADGELDYPDDFLATLDLVLASLHTSLRQPREKVTQRLLNAINNPHVDIIGHPTGRKIPDREGADLDMEAVIQAAAKSGVALEINASPYRLDLDDKYARRTRELGAFISINTDSHSAKDMQAMRFGVQIARRAWLGPEHVINTWSDEKLLAWLKDKKSV